MKQLDRVIKLENRLIPLFNKHISSSLFFSALKEAERAVIVGEFEKLAVSGSKHVEVLNSIKKEVEKGKNNVY